MTFPVPNLDDRTFVDLVLEARERARNACPAWTDMSVNDPGMALIEVFAHLTEVMIYRLNRLPEKSYLTFLNLIGLSRRPPSAAWVELTFARDSRETDSEKPTITIAPGTRVTTGAGALSQTVFVVPDAVVIPAGQDSAVARGHHCTIIDGELLGTGTGRAGQRFTAAHAPIVTTTEPLSMVLGVQVVGDRDERRAAREFGGHEFESGSPSTVSPTWGHKTGPTSWTGPRAPSSSLPVSPGPSSQLPARRSDCGTGPAGEWEATSRPAN